MGGVLILDGHLLIGGDSWVRCYTLTPLLLMRSWLLTVTPGSCVTLSFSCAFSWVVPCYQGVVSRQGEKLISELVDLITCDPAPCYRVVWVGGVHERGSEYRGVPLLGLLVGIIRGTPLRLGNQLTNDTR